MASQASSSGIGNDVALADRRRALCKCGLLRRGLGVMLGLVANVMTKTMRVEASAEAVDFILRQGGRLWVWAARPRLCCWGTPAYMYAATERPKGLSDFDAVSSAPAGLEIWFRAPSGRVPDVLEIEMRGRRRPRVEAYWDGCVIAL